MQFRSATVEDLPQIVTIYNESIPGRLATADTQAVKVADKLAWFHTHNISTRPVWMVEVNEQLIGWVSFKSFYGRPAYDGTAEISIYLSSSAQGKGYGKKILEYCINKAPALKIHSLLGFIFNHNTPSMQLFLKAGFTQWGLLPDVAVMDEQYYSLCILGLKINQPC